MGRKDERGQVRPFFFLFFLEFDDDAADFGSTVFGGEFGSCVVGVSGGLAGVAGGGGFNSVPSFDQVVGHDVVGGVSVESGESVLFELGEKVFGGAQELGGDHRVNCREVELHDGVAGFECVSEFGGVEYFFVFSFEFEVAEADAQVGGGVPGEGRLSVCG